VATGPMKWLGPVVLAVGVVLACDVGAAERGIFVQLSASDTAHAPPGDEVRLYSDSYALVVGIDRYTEGWPRLANAVSDAEKVGAALRARGFDVTVKEDLDSDDLKRTLEEFFVIKGADPEARLFVWFAGHGHTMGREAYLVPADAPLPDDEIAFRLRALSMRRFGEFVRTAQAKHALVVFDSCFSGTIFAAERSLPPAAVTRATTLPVRQFVSAGEANQKGSDDGMFAKLFIRAISGETPADANKDGYLTGSELGLFLADRVTNLTDSHQTPRYGKLRDEDFDRGDFVFVVAAPGDQGAPTPVVQGPGGPGVEARWAGAPARDRDSLVWNAIRNSDNPGMFEAYLTEFPDGLFAAPARQRMDLLRKARAGEAPTREPETEILIQPTF